MYYIIANHQSVIVPAMVHTRNGESQEHNIRALSCRIDGDVSDDNTKLYGDGSVILIIYFSIIQC